MTIAAIIDNIIRREGGFVDHPADRGGPTCYGITEAVAREQGYQGSMQDLPRSLAEKIYWQDYVRGPRFDAIDDARLRELVVDAGVNHGPRQAAKWLQCAVGVSDDGRVGPITLEAVNCRKPAPVFWAVFRQRMCFYGELITRDPTQAAFAHGWMNRLAEFI